MDTPVRRTLCVGGHLFEDETLFKWILFPTPLQCGQFFKTDTFRKSDTSFKRSENFLKTYSPISWTILLGGNFIWVDTFLRRTHYFKGFFLSGHHYKSIPLLGRHFFSVDTSLKRTPFLASICYPTYFYFFCPRPVKDSLQLFIYRT